jgi:hypothetical protein
MLKRVLLLTTSAFLLACGAIDASAQQGPTPQIQQQQSEQERQLQSAQTPRRAVQDDIEDDGGDPRREVHDSFDLKSKIQVFVWGAGEKN